MTDLNDVWHYALQAHQPDAQYAFGTLRLYLQYFNSYSLVHFHSNQTYLDLPCLSEISRWNFFTAFAEPLRNSAIIFIQREISDQLVYIRLQQLFLC